MLNFDYDSYVGEWSLGLGYADSINMYPAKVIITSTGGD